MGAARGQSRCCGGGVGIGECHSGRWKAQSIGSTEELLSVGLGKQAGNHPHAQWVVMKQPRTCRFLRPSKAQG